MPSSSAHASCSRERTGDHTPPRCGLLAASILRLRTLICLACIAIGLGGCSTLPEAPPHVYQAAQTPAGDSPLALFARRAVGDGDGDGLSAFHTLLNNRHACQARLTLFDTATTSIDAQYFLWQGDMTGLLMLDRLLKAADRGVRVRLLVDDLVLRGSWVNLAAASTHPNFEIRVYNPAASLANWITEFPKLNRRMHNKLLIADNRLAIIGGRNIGDEYCGLGRKYNFLDLDLLVAGAVMPQISDAFDKYWNHDTAYPALAYEDQVAAGTLEKIRKRLARNVGNHADDLVAFAEGAEAGRDWLLRYQNQFVTGRAWFLQDHPLPGDEAYPRLIDMLRLAYQGQPSQHEIIMVSPYFLPAEKMLHYIRQTSERGVNVRIFTNSLGSNDHTMVNAHYKKYRKPVLNKGAELYEFRHDQPPHGLELADTTPADPGFTSLHIKAFVRDRHALFVGSLNIDPRAMVINTENGLFIESEALGRQLGGELDRLMSADSAWQLALDTKQRVIWQAGNQTLTRQPARNVLQRIKDFIYRLIPAESQL